jgi:hypothetical protein
MLDVHDFGSVTTRELTSFVHLAPAMLIAMLAGNRKIAQIVRATVHSSLLMLNGRADRTVLRERTLTVAAFSALASDQLVAYPLTIRGIIPETRHVPASYTSRNLQGKLKGFLLLGNWPTAIPDGRFL